MQLLVRCKTYKSEEWAYWLDEAELSDLVNWNGDRKAHAMLKQVMRPCKPDWWYGGEKLEHVVQAGALQGVYTRQGGDR